MIYVVRFKLFLDEGPSIPPTTTPQVPIIDGPITRSKARKLHQDLDKIITYFLSKEIDAIHELPELGERTMTMIGGHLEDPQSVEEDT